LTPLRNGSELRVLILSAAVPQTWYAGSLLLYRLLQHHPGAQMKAVGPRPQPQSDVLSCEYSELVPQASSRLDLTRLAELKRSLSTILPVGRIADVRVERAVGSFQPDVVVTVMERFDYLEAAYRYCRRHDVPLALIVHDRLESFERVYPPFSGEQRRRIAAIYRAAAARFCVSPEMEQRLADEYGAPGPVLYPNRSDGLESRPIEDSRYLKCPPRLTIGYAGAMNYGYGERIAEVMPVLAAAGMRVRVYAREAPPALPGVEYAGFEKTPELWRHVQQSCDAVWLPYSHNDALRSLYETHFPSKLTEYLALGMPVAITGPSYATGVRWGIRHPQGALTVADSTPERIGEAFTRLRDDAAMRMQLAAGAREAGDADFDPARIRDIFFATLRDATRGAARQAT
jgi:glycosyltransferase involved in cell wall biosynthesis